MHVPLWQSEAWKEYQEALGKEVRTYDEDDTHALVIIDRTVGGYCTWDIPRGPIGKNRENLLEKIIQDAKKDKCFSLYFSPKEALDSVVLSLSVQQAGSVEGCKTQTSSRHEQPEATRIIDLTQSEEDILAQMKQKGRYNIRVAEKNGVTVTQSNDIEAFYSLLQATGERDGFTVKPKREYEMFLRELEGSFLLLASIPLPCSSLQPSPMGYGRQAGGGNPVGETSEHVIAGLMGVIYNNIGYYYYGASSYEHRALMAPYLLQREAMRRCKKQGCEKYDLLGVAPSAPHPDPLPEGEGKKGHPWSGVSRFKEQFGGEVTTYPPEQEIPLRPVIKKLLNFKRNIF